MRGYLLVFDGTAFAEVVGSPARRTEPGAAKLERMSSPFLHAASALRHFVHLSGALAARGLVDGEPSGTVAVSRLGAIEIAVGQDEAILPHGAALPDPPDLGEVRRLAAFAVDAETGEVTGTIGGLPHLADAVVRLAVALGGRSVAVVELETTTPGLPLVLSGRVGEPVLVTIGEAEFELPGPRR